MFLLLSELVSLPLVRCGFGGSVYSTREGPVLFPGSKKMKSRGGADDRVAKKRKGTCGLHVPGRSS